jgi:peptidyl-prolyl cis-trans isomerase SurA
MKGLKLLGLLAVLAGVPAFPSDRHLVEGIVVRVNDRILTTADMKQRLADTAAEAGKPVPPASYPEFVQQAADELCILERAAELKLEVSDEEIKARIAQLRQDNHVTDDASFDAMLRSSGLTLETLKARLRDATLVQRLLSREVGDLPITEEELRQRYERDKAKFMIGERVHLEHIVMPVNAGGSGLESTLALARRLAAAARASGNFKALVEAEVAAGRGTGGDLGVVVVADLRPEVQAVVSQLKVGEVSDPFTSSAGVHVVQLLERIPPTARPFSEVENELRQQELEQRYRARLADVVTELKKRYVVETHPELMATIK